MYYMLHKFLELLNSVIKCTVYITHCALYNVPCTLQIIQCTVYSVHCTLYNVFSQCTCNIYLRTYVNNVYSTIYSLYVYFVYYTLYNVYNVHYKLYNVHTLYNVQCTNMYIVHICSMYDHTPTHLHT